MKHVWTSLLNVHIHPNHPNGKHLALIFQDFEKSEARKPFQRREKKPFKKENLEHNHSLKIHLHLIKMENSGIALVLGFYNL